MNSMRESSARFQQLTMGMCSVQVQSILRPMCSMCFCLCETMRTTIDRIWEKSRNSEWPDNYIVSCSCTYKCQMSCHLSYWLAVCIERTNIIDSEIIVKREDAVVRNRYIDFNWMTQNDVMLLTFGNAGWGTDTATWEDRLEYSSKCTYV